MFTFHNNRFIFVKVKHELVCYINKLGPARKTIINVFSSKKLIITSREVANKNKADYFLGNRNSGTLTSIDNWRAPNNQPRRKLGKVTFGCVLIGGVDGPSIASIISL